MIATTGCNGCEGRSMVHNYECRFTRLSQAYEQLRNEYETYVEHSKAEVKVLNDKIKELSKGILL